MAAWFDAWRRFLDGRLESISIFVKSNMEDKSEKAWSGWPGTVENVKSVVFDAETVDVDPTICAVDSELASKAVCANSLILSSSLPVTVWNNPV